VLLRVGLDWRSPAADTGLRATAVPLLRLSRII
jgi:hypothetical protein